MRAPGRDLIPRDGGRPMPPVPDMHAHNIDDGEAGATRFIRSTLDASQIGKSEQLFRLGSDSRFCRNPSKVGVAISYVASRTYSGRLEVVAELAFSVGKAAHRGVEVDVPAGGTVFALPAADGLEIKVRADGDAREAATFTELSVNGTVSYLSDAHARPATRTIFWTLAAETTVIKQIPKFARGYTILSTVPASLGAATVVDLLAGPLAGSPILAAPVSTEARYVQLPAGADSMRITSGAAQVVRVIFELQF